jgi:hypothetical protein
MHSWLGVRARVQGREGKVVQVYRRKWVIHVERITREKVNGELIVVVVLGSEEGFNGAAQVAVGGKCDPMNVAPCRWHRECGH